MTKSIIFSAKNINKCGTGAISPKRPKFIKNENYDLIGVAAQSISGKFIRCGNKFSRAGLDMFQKLFIAFIEKHCMKL